MNKAIICVGLILATLWFVFHGIYVLQNQHTDISLEGNEEQQAYTRTYNSLGEMSNWFWVLDFLVASILFVGFIITVSYNTNKAKEERK